MEREETVEEGEEIERERKGRLRRLGGKNKNENQDECSQNLTIMIQMGGCLNRRT